MCRFVKGVRRAVQARRGIALGDLLGRLVDQTADAQRLILVGQADADIKIAVRLTVGLGQIASSLSA